MRRVLLSVALLASASLLLVGCRSSASLDGRQGLRVDVRVSPLQPGEHVGVDNSGPLPGAPVEIQWSSGGAVRTAVSDEEGHIFVSLAPGSYLLVAKPLGDATFPSPPGPQQVTVPMVGVANARLEYDTGIR